MQAVQPIYDYRSSDRTLRNAQSKRELIDSDGTSHVYMVDGRRRKLDKRYLIAVSEHDHGWPEGPECFGCGEVLYPTLDDDDRWAEDPDVLSRHPHRCAEDVMKCRPHEDRRVLDSEAFAYDSEISVYDDESGRSEVRHMFHLTHEKIENLIEWEYRKELEELVELYGEAA
jgi:hypothetical protein